MPDHKQRPGRPTNRPPADCASGSDTDPVEVPGLDAASPDPAAELPDPAAGRPDAGEAAAVALARARKAARDRGLRPGSRPTQRRRPAEPLLSGTARDGRDPTLLGDQLGRLLLDRGWNADVAVGSVVGRWPTIVGEAVAAHCTPVIFEEGVLTVRCDSTAWATNLRLMSSTLLGRLEAEAGEGVVTELRVVGPSAPSWSRGLRRAPGPGPRDTYG